MVYLLIFCGTYEYARTPWWWFINGKRVSNHQLDKTEAEHTNIHINLVCVSGCLYYCHVMDKILARYSMMRFFNNVIFQDNKVLCF